MPWTLRYRKTALAWPKCPAIVLSFSWLDATKKDLEYLQSVIVFDFEDAAIQALLGGSLMFLTICYGLTMFQ
jgi:hypothetical protein